MTPHENIQALISGGFAARCIQVVSDLGVADHIGDQPAPVEELAAACGAKPDALDRVLRFLAAYGLFERQEGGYDHTPSSRLLRSDHPMTMRPLARLTGLPVHRESLAQLQHSVMTGAPGVEILEPAGFWAYLSDRPDEAEIFGRAMTAKAGADVAAVSDAYDFNRFNTIADIGGGRGHLLRAILDSAPSAKGILFDQPSVINILDFADQSRLTPQTGDFFAGVPAAEAYVLMDVLHDWRDEECTAILGTIRRAASVGSTLLIIENVIPDDQATPAALTMDIIMLAVTGGRERTASQLSVLLERVGFGFNRVIETRSPMRIVEASAV
jgi:C-methyltransferase